MTLNTKNPTHYFIWGGDTHIYLPYIPSKTVIESNLIFSGFIKETNENYRDAEHSISQVPTFSFNQFLKHSQKNDSILVVYFQSKWANKYLYQQLKLLESNRNFRIQIMDIIDFSIKFNFSLIYDNQNDVSEKVLGNISLYKNMINRMSDDFSKLSLQAYLDSFIEKSAKPLINFLQPVEFECFNAFSNKFSFMPNDEEIFLDIGAYSGDTILKFINATPNGNYKAIHGFEPNPAIFKALKDKTAWLPNLTAHQLALSNRESSVSFIKENMGSRFATNDEKDNRETIEVKACTLDSVIEDATLIKIDVEGFESEVIEGGSKLIKKNKPHLVIDTYHHANDAIKIFDTVMNIHNYKYVGWRMNHHFLNTFYFSETQKLT